MQLERHERGTVARKVAETIFSGHAAIYVMVNLFLLFIWAATGMGYFWPIWVIVPWGFALAIHAWATWGLHYRRT